ncbi:MAG: mercury(II) reductase [Chlorobi bacterium]|nr:mercury(II) reductase [Chlorobiota bacterium]
MSCDNCATSIEKHFKLKQGVVSNKVSYPDKKGEFVFDPAKISKDEIRGIIDKETHYNVVGEIRESNSPSNEYDLIIIGGGSAAFSAAIKAEGLGLATLMVNGGLDFGGTCVNVGCVPSKNLIRAGETAFHAQHSNFAGVKPKGVEIDFARVIKDKNKLVASLQQKKYMDVVSSFKYLKMISGWAEFIDGKTILVNGKDRYSALKFLIATGATTKIPDIEGLAGVNYLTNVSLFEMEEQPKSMIVLGGGYIALEIAQAYHRLGTKVSLLQRSGQVLSKQTADVAGELARHLRKEGVDIQTNLRFDKVSQIGGNVRLVAEQNGVKKIFEAGMILVSTGIKPNTDRLAVRRIGLELTGSGHIKVDKHLQSNLPNIYAAGDCIDTPSYVYTAAFEGKTAVENAFTGTDIKVDYSSLPWVVFTDPQVAGAGLDEKTAKGEGIPFEVSKIELKDVPRSIAANDTRGFIKLIRNTETDKLIGARVVAPEGGELIQQLSMAIKYGISVKELASGFYPYLTLSEGVKLAAITFGKDVATLSCCAT